MSAVDLLSDYEPATEVPTILANCGQQRVRQRLSGRRVDNRRAGIERCPPGVATTLAAGDYHMISRCACPLAIAAPHSPCRLGVLCHE